jgi:DNA-binding FrmR family transcriptional regulator
MELLSQTSQGTQHENHDDGPAALHSHGYLSSKDDYLKRLRRIEGQVGGLSRMVTDERYCIDILTQISAIQAALDKVALGLMDGHARHCIHEGAKEGRADEMASELMAAVGRLMKRG